ncbi:hypothetical protein PUN28_007939 [Cardiocondyla obscurior]|uniref:Uncharacterized protein n=1 Tax=Cardiocondyla obscurior TaxID=286306 RepID=A0AAW2FXB9_9HYME
MAHPRTKALSAGAFAIRSIFDCAAPSSPGLTAMGGIQRSEIFVPSPARERSYQFHKTVVALNGRDAQKANGLFQVYVTDVIRQKRLEDTISVFVLDCSLKQNENDDGKNFMVNLLDSQGGGRADSERQGPVCPAISAVERALRKLQNQISWINFHSGLFNI